VRSAAAIPTGDLVEEVRDDWPAPPAWLDAQEHAATFERVARLLRSVR
jgi:hypothetical protein